MAKSRWISLVQITFWCSVLVHRQPLHVEAISNSLQGQIQQEPQAPFQISPKELRRLRAKGLELMPNGNSISSGTVSGEPSCEELRAMWRYYRRNGRATELTNEIPQFPLGDVFWGLPTNPGEPQGFGPLSSGRSRPRFRPKGPRNPLYGKVLLKQEDKSSESGRGRRPMEQILELIGPSVQNPASHKSEPTLVLTPPLEPTPKSSIDKIRDILREERIQEGDGSVLERSTSGQSKEYGKVILSPPSGTDGRVANKPRELMTPFERIRFGHTDDLFNVNDESPRRRPNLFPIMKRRNGFIAMPMLNRQKSAWRPFAMAPHWLGRPTPSPERFEDSIIIVQDSEDREAQPLESVWENGFTGNDLIPAQSVAENVYEAEKGPVNLSLMAKEPFTVDESLPLCSVIKHEPCSVNNDCSCLGHGVYRCYAGQCQTLSLKGVYEDSSSEFWHPEPLSTLQLGAWTAHSSFPGLETSNSKRKRAVNA